MEITSFALGLALKLVIPTYYHIEDTTPTATTHAMPSTET